MSNKKQKTASERFQKLSQYEHILARPDTYIGGTAKIIQETWVLDKKTNRMIEKIIELVPGFLKIIDEILVNCRDASTRDENLKTIRIIVNRETNEISIWNDGEGIPVEKHTVHKMMIPEMCFGELLSGENFDDDEWRRTGGRNGFGAKLTNIFSKEFTVDIGSTVTHKRFQQQFTDNKLHKTKAKVTNYGKKNGYVSIKFVPDFTKFKGMKGIDDDTFDIIETRAYELAACTKQSVKVYFNGTLLQPRVFEKFMDLYLGPKNEQPRCYIRLHNEMKNSMIDEKGTEWYWDIGLSIGKDGYRHTSFVNGIRTLMGGKHVDYIVNQIIKKIREKVKDKKKRDVKPNQVKEHLWVFVNAEVVNPEFQSQTKDLFTSAVKDFKFKCTIPDKFINDFDKKCKIVSRIIDITEVKDKLDLKKTDGYKQRTLRINKLDDAEDAGTKNSKGTVLILTEGDSAKTFAITGLRVIGNKKYGVFPLRGKPINATNATDAQLNKNAEFCNIKKIVGLKDGVIYTDTNDLRYDHICIMADQDIDGSHIVGLFFDIFGAKWKSLFNIKTENGTFFKRFITPLVRAWKRKEVKLFFNMSDFEEWKQNQQSLKGWEFKYLKGLGGSESKHVVEYFKEKELYMKDITIENLGIAIKALDNAFHKDKADIRKKMLQEYDPNNVVDFTQPTLGIVDFINKEWIHYAHYSTARAIANICDGLKISQRKVLWGMIDIGCWKEQKLSGIQGKIGESSGYHHGETSMQQAMVKMAQSYPGSNNLNLLYPAGQFGTRRMNGADASGARYISTFLQAFVQILFQSEDSKLLIKNRSDENKEIEPRFYIPIIPMVLVNGCSGMGTGYKTFIPQFNPLEIIDCIKTLLNTNGNGTIHNLTPWYHNFQGIIEPDKEKGGYNCKGMWKRLNAKEIHISELPIGSNKAMSFEAYKYYLEKLLPNSTAKTKPVEIQDFHYVPSDIQAHFTIKFKNKTQLDKLIETNQLESKLKLITHIDTSKMYLFNELNQMTKFESANEILMHHFRIRLIYYEKRKQLLIEEKDKEIVKLSAKARFFEMINNNKLKILRQKKDIVIAQLKAYKFPILKNKDGKVDERYGYLLRLPIAGVTDEEIAKYRADRDVVIEELEILKRTSPSDLWLTDLDELKTKITNYYEETDLKKLLEEEGPGTQSSKSKTRRKRKTPKKTTPAKKLKVKSKKKK